MDDRAKRGDSGALYLQSATAGLNSNLRCSQVGSRLCASGVESRVSCGEGS